MAKMSFGPKGVRVRSHTAKGNTKSAKPLEDVVRELKIGQQVQPGADYREKSLAIHGLICAHCGREFDQTNRQLLTVHHKDGNHDNNPPDGSNWENLCIYCHEDTHSRGLLGDYFGGKASRPDIAVAYQDKTETSLGVLGEKLKKILTEKKRD